jgi:hypothetical protein
MRALLRKEQMQFEDFAPLRVGRPKPADWTPPHKQ